MFQNRSFVVSGGTGALGQVVCQHLIQAGAEVVTSMFDSSELKRLPSELSDHNLFHVVEANLTREEDVEILFRRPRYPVAGFIGIAGGFAMGPFADTTLEAFNHQLTMNLTTFFLGARRALNIMDPNQPGRIIGIGSFSILQRIGGMAPYRAAKAALVNLIESIAEETLDSSITANVLLPTIMNTAANRQAMPDQSPDKWVQLDQVARTILFLCQPNHGHITGAAIPLRGRI